MESQQKESYAEPVLMTHELLRDITGQKYREKTSDKVNDKAGGES
ncbi:MAG: hypothetical protein NW703_00100 [Nitrospiraceae bacterium]